MGLRDSLRRIVFGFRTFRQSVKHRKDYKGEFARLAFSRLWADVVNTEGAYVAFQNRMKDFISRHIDVPCAESFPAPEKVDKMRIWVMWWQGEEAMPPIVKACMRSIVKYSRGLDIVVISQYNAWDYIKVTDTVRRKLDAGQITLAALSDIVRSSLLKDYGGIWIDSTILLTGDFPAEALTADFSTVRVKPLSTEVYRGRWCLQFFACAKTHSPVFESLYQLWMDYWETFDSNIEYLMVDYFIDYSYRNIESVRHLIDSVSVVNEHHYSLGAILNDKFDEQKAEEIESWGMHKLSCRLRVHPGDTFFNRIASGQWPMAKIETDTYAK